MATKKKAAVANTKAPAATEKKTAVVNAAVSKPAKTEMVAIFKTTYGYYRYWVKNILADGGIIKYRFIKNPDSNAGVIWKRLNAKMSLFRHQVLHLIEIVTFLRIYKSCYLIPENP